MPYNFNRSQLERGLSLECRSLKERGRTQDLAAPMFQGLEMGFVSYNWIVGVKALIRAPGGVERDSKSIHLRIGRILPLFHVAVDVIEIRRSRSYVVLV